jgi:hypothetical protein
MMRVIGSNLDFVGTARQRIYAMKLFRGYLLKIQRGTLARYSKRSQRGSSSGIIVILLAIVGALLFILLKEDPPDPDDPDDCVAGFEIDLVVEETKPNGDAWDLLAGDEPPDPAGELTLYDEGVQTEVFLKRQDKRKITAKFFNGKQRRLVHRSAMIDLRIADVDAINFGWSGKTFSTNDFIAHFEGVDLGALIDGQSVKSGSATLTGARCLSQ